MKLSDNKRALSTGAAVLSLVASSSAQAAAACKDGLHVIVARASNEPQGYGILMSVANNIARSVPDSDMVSVNYPATVENYAMSQAAGVDNLAQMIMNYGEQCPGHRMAVLGYSQGAQVVGDALIGAQYDNVASLATKPGLDQKYIDSVCGVVMMGDPAHVAGQFYHVGSSTQHGFYPRSNAHAFYSSGLASRMQSYCDADDTYCDTGSSSAVHKGYVPQYGATAAEFVVNSCNSAGAGHAKRAYAVAAPITKSVASKPPVAKPSYPAAAPPAHPSYPAAPPAHPSYPAAPPAHPSYPAAPPVAHPSYPAAPPAAHPSYPAAPPPVVRPSVPASVAPSVVRPSLPPPSRPVSMARPSVPGSGAPSMARPSLPPASGSPSMARPSLPPASGSPSMARPSLPPHASAPASMARPSLPPPSAPASMVRPSLPPPSAPASAPRPSLPPASRPPVSMPHASVPVSVQPSVPASMTVSMPHRAMNATVSAPSKGNNTGTIVETAPDVTPSPTSNGDQGIYTTRATASPTGGASPNSASIAGAGLTVVLGSLLAFALNL